MIIFGYLAAILMGLILGLIGAGGSILTVPILVYCFKMPAFQATTYSLLIVGVTAFFGAISYQKKGLVDLKSAFIFAVPAAFCVFLTRSFLIPNLPEFIFNIHKEDALMLGFALLMIVAATSMLKSKNLPQKNTENQKTSIAKLVFGSGAIGSLTGLVGVGGGFLIVPTLINLFALDAKKAIGTSLVVIAANSFIGFKSDVIFGEKLDWLMLLSLCLATLIGMIAGIFLSKKIDSSSLKKIFAYFVILVAILIFTQTLKQILAL